MVFENGDFLLFTGDSVTEAGRAFPVGEGLFDGVGNGYVRAVDSLINVFCPDLHLRIANTGVSGNTVVMLKERWQNEIVDLKPDWLSICIGINDVYSQFHSPFTPHYHVCSDVYRQTLDELVDSMKDKTKGIILMTPFLVEPCKTDAARRMADEYGQIVRVIAEKYHAHFIDLQAVIDEYCRYRHSSFLTLDRLHPNPVGSMLIARAFLEEMGIYIDVKLD